LSSVYILLILFIYYRQWKYRLLIDDPVPRDGYLYELPREVEYTWYDKRRSLTSVVTNVVTMVATCGYIHLLWGWQAAVLFAVFPLNVSGVAWNTGNYYMSTVLLCLASMFVMGFVEPLGGLGLTNLALGGLGIGLYVAALNSTLLALPFFLVTNALLVFPVVGFLFGKRLRAGLSKRGKRHKDMGVHHGFSWSNFRNVPRVVGYYIYMSIYPKRLGFFHQFGKVKEPGWWLSVLVCLSFGVMFAVIDLKMAVWWFVCIGVFSQVVILGQFVTERYTLLANVAFCVLLSYLPKDVVLVLATLYFCRSLSYIGAWASNERLFSYSAVQHPRAGENWVNLASYYIERGDHFSAIKPLLTACRMVKGDKYGIWCNLANCYASGGFYEKALEYTNKALEVATLDKIPGMMEQVDKLQEKINIMKFGNKKLKKMGVI